MINFANNATKADMDLIQCLDVLGDVRDDVLGAAQTLEAMKSSRNDMEPQQIGLLADVLLLASEALEGVWVSLEMQHHAKGGGDD